MSNTIQYDNLIAFHPGSYVEDIIDDLNITQNEFAYRLGTTPKTISKLVNAEIRLSSDLAFKLEKLTGVDYETWMSLQNAYDKKIREIEESKNKDEEKIADIIDLKYFKKHGIITDKRYSKQEKIKVLRRELNVSDLSYLAEFNPAVSYRSSGAFDKKTIVNSNIMLELASSVARKVESPRLDRGRIEKYLPRIREMIYSKDISFWQELKALLLECGVVLVGLPNLKNSMLNGATRRFTDGSALILITDRNKAADIFWFSLIHEVGHILNNDFYTDLDDIDNYLEKEARADKFASDFFIDSTAYERFVNENNLTEESIIAFAREMKVPEYILLGRLKKDGHVDYNQFTKYSIKYELSFEK